MVILKDRKAKPYITGSTATLVRIAGIGGLVIGAAGYTFRILLQKKFRNTEFYQKATDYALEYKALVNFLGEPVKFGDVDVGQSGANYATNTEAAGEVPIRGSKNRGIMYFKAMRREMIENVSTTNSESQKQMNKYDAECEYCKTVKLSPWEIQSIEIAIDGRPNERIIVPLDITKS